MFADGYTSIHTLLSLVAILTGVFAVTALFRSGIPDILTTVFLATAFATSATGFGFPFSGVLPSHVVGALALLILAAMAFARFVEHFAGAWRWVYAVGMVVSLYLLVFVLIAQLFAKIPALTALAPTQSEPPFAIAQLVVLVIFAFLAIKSAKAFRPSSVLARR